MQTCAAVEGAASNPDTLVAESVISSPMSLAPAQSSSDTTTWKPNNTVALKEAGFFSKWPGVLGSTKWRTPPYIIDNIGLYGQVTSSDRTFLELGCGDGRILIAMAKKYPKLRCEGYEINAAVHAEAVRNVQEAGLSGTAIVHLDTAYSANVSAADVVYAYSNKRGLRQLHSLLSKLKPGARLILYQNDVKLPLPASRVRHKCVDPNNALVVWPVYVYTFHSGGSSSSSGGPSAAPASSSTDAEPAAADSCRQAHKTGKASSIETAPSLSLPPPPPATTANTTSRPGSSPPSGSS